MILPLIIQLRRRTERKLTRLEAYVDRERQGGYNLGLLTGLLIGLALVLVTR